MMPSSVAPTRVSHFFASASLVVAGDSRMRPLFGKYFRANASSRCAAGRQRLVGQHGAVGVLQQIEHDQQRRRFLGELLHAARRRMDALQQRVEREHLAFGHDDLAVEHEGLGLERAHRLDHVGEIARQRLAGFRLQRDRVAVAEYEAAEAVPLRLVLPLGAGRNLIDRQGLHGGERGTQLTNHGSITPMAGFRPAIAENI